MIKPLLRIVTSDPDVASSLIEFLNTLNVVNPELTLVTISPDQTEQEHQEIMAALQKSLDRTIRDRSGLSPVDSA